MTASVATLSTGGGIGPVARPIPADWPASLGLRFARIAERTVLIERRHVGPLVIQKPLYPEGGGVCQVILVHAPGGIAGGDGLELEIEIGARAHVLATTPAATRWYKSAGRAARQSNRLRVQPGASLEWLPQETILFDAAEASIATEIELIGDATYAGWEIACLGRRAAGEIFASGLLHQALAIRRDGQPIWTERAHLAGGDPLLQSIVGYRGHAVFGTMIVAAGAVPEDLVEQCRAVVPRHAASVGLTALPEVLAARFLGDSAQDAAEYFEALRAVLRPFYAGLAAVRPRIWDT